MARRNAAKDFFEGFNMGWDTVGKVGAAYDINKLEDDEKRLKAEGGLQAGDSGKYSIFGMEFDDKPSDFDVSYARNQAQAGVYDKWGDKETARGLRADALTNRMQGQQFKTSEQAYEHAAVRHPIEMRGLRLGNQKTQGDIDYNAQIRPLLLEYQQLQNTGQEGSNRGRELANTLQQMTINQRELTDPIAVDQAKATLASTKSGTEGQNIANTFAQATLTARTAEAIANSEWAQKSLDPKLKKLLAEGNLAEIQAEFAKVSFQPKIDQMTTSLDISKQQLTNLMNESPHRLQGLIDSNILTALNIDAKTLDNKQKAGVDAVNQAYYDALTKGDFTGVEETLMPYAAQVYNDGGIVDDDNKAVLGEDGKYYIVGPDGGRIGDARSILEALPLDQKRDAIRQAQAYAVASITGNFGAIDELYKTEAWIDYTQAQTEALKKGKGLTKDQWIIGRLEKNPNDKIALAWMLGAENVGFDINDPTLNLGSGSVPPPLDNDPDGGGTNPDPVAPASSSLVDEILKSGGVSGVPALSSFVESLQTPIDEARPGARGPATQSASREKARQATLAALNNPQALSAAIADLERRIQAIDVSPGGPRKSQALVRRNEIKRGSLISLRMDLERRLKSFE